jgi:predicted Zn-dependent protease
MRREICIAFAAGFVAFLLGSGCSTPPPPRDPPFDASSPLEPGEEFAFGRSICARLMTGLDCASDPAAREYVANVGGAVAAASKRPDPYDGWRFYIVKDARVRTFSAPCGFVFVTTGALKACTNEDALAALLAQEMAHSALAHALDGEAVLSVRPTRESWPYSPEWGHEEFRRICDAAAGKSSAGWSEPQEQAASVWAGAALAAAGYDTTGAAVPPARVSRFEEALRSLR